MESQPLLQPLNMKGLQLRNRIIMAPLTRNRSDNQEHAATELTATYYAQRATAGFIITEGTVISMEAVGYINVPGIYNDAQVKGWKLVTSAVHEKNGLIFAQLWHVGRISHPDLLDGALPLGPSALNPFTQAYTQKGYTDTVVAREMTLEDIKRTIHDYKKAAINAIKAGFDGITNKRYTRESGNQILEEKNADLVSFGVPFISNPDLVERFKNLFPLSEADPATFYTSGAKGYIDYPTYK